MHYSLISEEYFTASLTLKRLAAKTHEEESSLQTVKKLMFIIQEE